MKLELKHLAPYLPYGVMIYSKFKNSDNYSTFEINHKNFNSTLTHNSRKPILRPLSDLSEVIEHNNEKFIPTELLDSDEYPIDFFVDTNFEYILDWINCYQKNHHILFLPFGLINQLIEWHFDVFGLIEKGLAIDINTIKK